MGPSLTGFCIYDPIFQWIQESIWTKDLLSLVKVKDIMYDISLFYAQFKFVEVRYKKRRNPVQVHRVTKLWMEPCLGVAEIDDRARNVAEALTANRINQTDH